VWLAELPQSMSDLLLALKGTLSSDELERARRFHFVRDRDRYVLRRGILRQILSYYLGCVPAAIDFSYQASGKPQLAHPAPLSCDLRFNISHSGDAVLYAVTSRRDIGVDIELIRPEIEWALVANCFFAPAEIAALQRLPVHLQSRGFFNCWVRKEAYLKARGEGLSIPLDSFEVSLRPGDAPLLLRAADESELQQCTMWDVPLTEDLAGAVVVKGHPSGFRFFHWRLERQHRPRQS
jgi:4'-phosphopantetheinyl transferase